MSQLPFDWSPAEKAPPGPPTTVSEVCAQIAVALARGVADPLHVEGEVVSHVERRGHWYFTLRDDHASLSCVMWASDVRKCRHPLRDGDAVVATGSITHWAKHGRTQLRVQQVAPAGAGARQAAFRALCDALREKGWFDESAKQGLPRCPGRVCVLTSEAGAAIHDVCHTAAVRWPACRLLLVDVPVQGPRAAAVIARTIARIDNDAGIGVDAILLTRGGGAREDLDCFDDPGLAQAIHDCRTPIVAAIGHESDTTIAELVADRRAATPTQAVMLLLPDVDDERQRVDLFRQSLWRLAARHHDRERIHLSAMESGLAGGIGRRLKSSAADLAGREADLLRRQPHRVLAERRAVVAAASARLQAAAASVVGRSANTLAGLDLTAALRQRLEAATSALGAAGRVLDAVGPTAILERGYSVTMTDRHELVRHGADCRVGQRLRTILASGEIESEVTAVKAGTQASPDLPSRHA